MSAQVLVLANRDDVRGVATWLRSHGRAIEDVDRSHDELACVRVRTADGTELAVLGDHVGDVVYLTVAGPEATLWTAELARAFACVGVAEVLAGLHEGASPQAWIAGLSRLAVLRGGEAGHGRAVLEAWTRALGHPHRAVRRAAIRTGWGALAPETAAADRSAMLAAVRERVAVEAELSKPLRLLLDQLERVTT
ncbi:MAG: hypothetical protein K1X88_30590 [Nannocystaceae bacterium]|nr:hypothetical protein [Nannocystaceae bacterium]